VWVRLLVREAIGDLTTATRARYARAAREADEGVVSLFMAVFFVGVLLLCGVIVDAGRGVHANVHASDLAAKAARVGAQQLDLASLRAGTTVLDPSAAQDAASAYLAAHHIRGQVAATDQDVTVTVTWPIRYTLLAALRPGATAVQTRTAAAIAGP
jgi:Flp pilus assembly protein TadG